jgi:DNA topoisomerase VI subunit A
VVSSDVGNLSSRVPILALVDADPYGLDILSVYKYGSYATAHEGDTLTAPRIELLGIKITEMQGYEGQVWGEQLTDLHLDWELLPTNYCL